MFISTTGLALQLVWALIGLRGRGAEPGTKVPELFCLIVPSSAWTVGQPQWSAARFLASMRSYSPFAHSQFGPSGTVAQ